MTTASGMTASELVAAIRQGSTSAHEAATAAAAAIERTEPRVRAFITITLDEALDHARVPRGGPLTGLPIAVKDLFDTTLCRTTYGSAIFSGHRPTANAGIVERALGAGATIMGKTSTHEFGWGITSVNPHYGTPCNPWDERLVPGGSSGGSAAAVAHGQVPVALAGDTGGSIRVPAACCGVVGFKPSFGRISGRGAFALAPSLDHPGVIARDPRDAALVYRALSGVDPSDATTAGPWPAAAGDTSPSPLRVGYARELDPRPDAPIVAVLRDALHALEGVGAQLVEVALPSGAAVFDAFRTIQAAEVLDTHRRAGIYPARRDQYGADVRSRLEAAEQIALADYLAALRARLEFAAAYARAFERADVLVTPVMGTAPVPIGQESVNRDGREVPFRDLVMPFTTPQDLLGLPACAIRAGFDDAGLPIAVQITGPRTADELVLATAQAFYDATPQVQSVVPAAGPGAER
ncbi:MAG: amidase [Conexibacter sp.]